MKEWEKAVVTVALVNTLWTMAQVGYKHVKDADADYQGVIYDDDGKVCILQPLGDGTNAVFDVSNAYGFPIAYVKDDDYEYVVVKLETLVLYIDDEGVEWDDFQAWFKEGDE